jgi:hypothetical protein
MWEEGVHGREHNKFGIKKDFQEMRDEKIFEAR